MKTTTDPGKQAIVDWLCFLLLLSTPAWLCKASTVTACVGVCFSPASAASRCQWLIQQKIGCTAVVRCIIGSANRELAKPSHSSRSQACCRVRCAAAVLQPPACEVQHLRTSAAVQSLLVLLQPRIRCTWHVTVALSSPRPCPTA